MQKPRKIGWMGPHGAVLSTPLPTAGLAIKRDFSSFSSSVLPAFKFKKKAKPNNKQTINNVGKTREATIYYDILEVAYGWL